MTTQPSSPVKVYVAHETERMQELNGSELAGFVPRALAWVIDFLLAAILLLAVVVGAGIAQGGHMSFSGKLGMPPSSHGSSHDGPKEETQKPGDFNFKLGLFDNLFSVLYLTLFFGLSTYLGNGRTIGKRIMGIRAVSLVHHRITLWHSIERALGYGASFLEFGFGFIQFFIEPNRRTAHDRLAETIVVKEPKKLK